MTALLEVENVGKRFGGFVALEEINLTVAPKERLGRSAQTARARARS